MLMHLTLQKSYKCIIFEGKSYKNRHPGEVKKINICIYMLANINLLSTRSDF